MSVKYKWVSEWVITSVRLMRQNESAIDESVRAVLFRYELFQLYTIIVLCDFFIVCKFWNYGTRQNYLSTSK